MPVRDSLKVYVLSARPHTRTRIVAPTSIERSHPIDRS